MIRSQADVAIVGFGPVGAVLAGLLGQRGLSVVVVERELDVFPLPRAAHIDHTGLRTLQELGCVDRLLPRMLANPGLDYVTADNRLLLRIPGDQGSISGLPASMYFHQPGFDRSLRRAAAAMPTVDVRLEAEMTRISEGRDAVTLETHGVAGDAAVTASFVVGCDGASSAVRGAVGIELEDLRFDERWLVVDLLLHEPVATLPRRAVAYCDPARPVFAIPIPDGRHRFELMLLPGEHSELMQRPETVRALLSSWLPANRAEVERAAVYVFHGLVARQWRAGRVLVAGDAAHQMPPFLGQGLCSGLRDAANLAWKLERVLRHGAPHELLETYTAERRPHVGAVVHAAVELGRMMCVLDPLQAAARDRRILADPLPAIERARFTIPPLPQGRLVLGGGGKLFIQPRVGGGHRLDDVVGSRFLVLARTRERLGGSARWWATETGALVATTDELRDEGGALTRWLDRHEASVVVVRPDRYVLAAGHELDPITDAVRNLLTADSTGSVGADAA